MKKPTDSRKKILWYGITALFILAVAGVLFWRFGLRHDPANDMKPKYAVPSARSRSAGGSAQADTTAKDTDTQNSTLTSEQVPVAPTGSVSIVDLGQADGYVNAKATVSNFTTTKCVYTFISAGADKPIIRTLDGACDGISIPEVEFQYIGIYTLTVTAYNGTSEKITASKDISVQ